MLSFIFTLILMISLSFVLYLMVIALPRVAEDLGAENQTNLLDRWAHSHIPEKVDTALNSFFLKFLRRMRVFMLKLDNTLGKHLKNMKRDDEAKKPVDFSDMKAPKEEEEETLKNH
jgi:hypothetical protein